MRARPKHSALPAAVCAGTAVAFAGLAGCFLIGVMALVEPSLAFGRWDSMPPIEPMSTADHRTLLVVLYVAASCCGVVAGGALWLALRKLP